MTKGACAFVAVIAALVGAAPASANTYCVPSGGAGCTNVADLQTALNDAVVNSGPDTVQLAAQTFTPANCNSSGFTYNSPESLTLVGAGALTVLTCPDNTGASHAILDLTGPVTVSDLHVHVRK